MSLIPLIAVKKKKLLTLGIVVLMAGGLVWCATPPEQAPIITNIVKGYRFDIPQEYIPRWGKDGQVVTPTMLLEATWPTMQPYIDPEDNTPVIIRSRNEISIRVTEGFMQLNETDIAGQRYEYFRSISEPWLKERIPVESRFGLLRFIYKNLASVERSGTLATFSASDLYLYPSIEKIEGMLLCGPEFEPDPFSERAKQMVKEGKFVKNPDCTHDFYMPEMNLNIHVRYQRVHLQDWQAIQEKVIALLRSFKK